MYAFFRVDGQDDSLAFAKRLVAEAGLGLAPGVAFGAEGRGLAALVLRLARPAAAVSEGVQRGWPGRSGYNRAVLRLAEGPATCKQHGAGRFHLLTASDTGNRRQGHGSARARFHSTRKSSMTHDQPRTRPKIVKANARSANDTGSPEVQVALLTARINELTPHFKTHAEGPPRPPRPAEDGQPAQAACWPT